MSQDLNGNGIADDLESLLAAIAGAGLNPTPMWVDEETQREMRRMYPDQARQQMVDTEIFSRNAMMAGEQQPTGTGTPIKQYSEQQVKAAATSAFQKAVGREVSEQELSNITTELNAELKKNPKGLDEQQFLLDVAKRDPEYAPYQQASTYFDAMLGALSGPAGRGI
jgi:hypothetical protein